MTPMTRARAGEMRIPNPLMAKYYAQQAGAGLIVTEATVISEQANGWLSTPGIYPVFIQTSKPKLGNN